MARLVWTESGGCSSCKHCAMDMEMDPYCVHPNVVVYHRYGVNISKAIADFCGDGDNLKLREKRETIEVAKATEVVKATEVAKDGAGQDGK